jgi:hypothetical protein
MKHATPFCLLLLTFIASRAVAQPAEDKVERKDGHRVWKLTSYLQGTAAEIRQQLNGQVNHLVESRKKQVDRIADLTTKIDQAKQHGENILLADDQYVRLEKSLKEAEAAKDQARKTGTPQDRLDAGAAYVKVKSAIDQRRKVLVDDDPNVVALTKELAEAKTQLHELEVSIGKEESWRRELVDAVHGSLLMQWPMRRGNVGILGPLIPQRSDGKDSFEANFNAGEVVQNEGSREGITSVGVIVHPVRVLVKGFEGAFEIGKPVAVNRAYQVAGGSEEGGRGVIVVKRLPDEVDELLEAIEAGPGLPAEELDRMLKLAERKDHPKKWGTVVSMITALPPDLRPKSGEKLVGDKARKADEWLGKELIGDTVDLTLTFQAIRLTDTGVDVFATAEAAGARKQHLFTLVCPESLRVKAEKIKPGQQGRVQGIIKSIRLNPDGTLDVKIVEAAF